LVAVPTIWPGLPPADFKAANVSFFLFVTLWFSLAFSSERRSTMLRKMFRNKKGQGLVEYGLIIAGVALICAAAISVFGHKTNDLIAAVAAILPGAHADDNARSSAGG
jgi:Flp pilus assembly pilin Flp